MTKACQVRVSGLVQGVGFRYSALAAARGFGVDGWVRNEADGSVRAMVQGDAAAVDLMVDWLRRGPPGAWVRSCEPASVPPDPLLRGFRIAPD
jgi:acylphosphatase